MQTEPLFTGITIILRILPHQPTPIYFLQGFGYPNARPAHRKKGYTPSQATSIILRSSAWKGAYPLIILFYFNYIFTHF